MTSGRLNVILMKYLESNENSKMTQKRVLFVNVTDVNYPRHVLLAEAYNRADYRVFVIERSKSLTYWDRCRALLKACKHQGPFDVVVLAEFAISYAWVSWLIARKSKACHVVDGFIGMYETHVEDTGSVTAWSTKGIAYRFVDWLAFFLANHYLIDTHARKHDLAKAHPCLNRIRKVHVLPVGAPRWALPLPLPDGKSTTRLLYYGNYIPLHGLEKFLRALSLISCSRSWQATIIGPKAKSLEYERLVEHLGLEHSVQFVDAIPEQELSAYIADHHIIVGIFGDSRKAQSVIPNKVWQGLASGRVVLTRQTRGLQEIGHLFPQQLALTPANSAADIIPALEGVVDTDFRELSTGESRTIVDQYVERHFEVFMSYFE